MTIRTKLMLTLAAVVLLVIAHGLIDSHYASLSRTEIEQLGKVAVAGSSATHDMLDTLSKLESSLFVSGKPDDLPANSLQIRDQGKKLFAEFHSQLNNVKVSFFGMSVVPQKETLSESDLQMEQLALLKNTEEVLNQVEAQWRDFTNCLPASPDQAEFIREHSLLPTINERMRPTLTRLDRLIAEQTGLEVQHILQQSQRSQEKMLIIVVLIALAILAVSLFLAKVILDPMEQLAAVATEVAAGNRQHRLPGNRTDELGIMASAFNRMLDVLQATTVSRDELEQSVRERTEELEREIRARQAAATELDRFFILSRDALSIGDFDGHFLRVNPAFVSLFGYSSRESYPLPLETGVHPDDVPVLRTKWRELANGAAAVDFEVRTRDKDGTWRTLAWKAASAPELKLIYGSARDVTELRHATEALQESERNLAITLNSIGDGVLVTDATGHIVRLNPIAEQLTGWKREEAVGRHVDEIFRILDEETRQSVVPPVLEAVAHAKTLTLAQHAVLLHRTGNGHPIADSCAPIRDPDGRVVGAVLVFRDVSEERRAEQQILDLNAALEERVESRTAELRESERRHRTLLSNLQGMVYRCRNDHDWTMEFVSEGCRSLLGIEPEDLTSSRITFNELIHPDDRELVRNEVRSAIAKQSAFTVEYRLKHADGKWRSAWEQGRAVFDEKGQVAALEGYITDSTHRLESERIRRALEDQLRQAQKLEAVGTLAGGIAHDFNNILAAILGSAELIKMDLAPDHPSHECLQQIFVAGNRARELVQQILMFSRRKESERGILKLQPVVKECLKLLRSTIPAMVEIKYFIDPNCAPVLADPTQIHQVIMNLCTNSWQALPERGGRIEVSLKMCEIDEVTAGMHPDLHAGSYVQLSVLDNGSGMDKATLERVFEPFFTTKPAGQGSGLGLSMVHGIVKSHEGAIVLESAPGKGTVFYIYLPAQAAAETHVPDQPKRIFEGNGEHILLVDDEELPGRAAERIIGRLKYNVERFTHPQEALERFHAAPDKFDLVISDLAMPMMSGADFAAAVHKIRSDIPVLLMTGLIDRVAEERLRKARIRKVLLKPVTLEIFGREIAQVLSGEGGI